MGILKGVVPAVLTPMGENGKVDVGGVKEYVDFLVEKGIDAIFVNGTTGEGLSLSVNERKEVLEAFVKAVDGRIKVVAHCGAMRFGEVEELLNHAQHSGADGVGIVTPFYYRLREDEIESFYAELAKKCEIPTYLYNIPSLTNNWINAKVATKLHEKFPVICGIKDSSGNYSHVLSLINDTPDDFDVLTGYDRAFLSVLFAGAKGCVSGPAAVFPEFFVALKKAYESTEYDKAHEIQKKLTKVSLALADGGSIPLLKAAMTWRGIKMGSVKRPLKSLSDEEENFYKSKLESVLQEVGISMKV